MKKLTQEQLDRCPEYRKKWLDIGLDTTPINRESAARALDVLYADEPKLPQYIWCQSPMSMILISILNEQGIEAAKDQGDRTFKELSDKALASLGKAELNKLVKAQTPKCVYGQHEASWVSFYDYMREVVGLEKETDILEPLKEVVRQVNWFLPEEDICYVSNRPFVVRFDDRDVLHNEFGPACGYRDGFGIYAWHGTRIPREWIEDKENLSAETALKWPQIEQRRSACEILGWAKILKELNAVVINDDGDPEIGILVEVEIPDIGRERFLRVQCGTGREFALPVPPEMETALQAQSWTWGIDETEFVKPEVRT